MGGVGGTALGVLFIGVLQNGLSLSGAPTYWQQIVTGGILVAAVLGDRLQAHPGWVIVRNKLTRRGSKDAQNGTAGPAHTVVTARSKPGSPPST
jgi:hypothetical protein